nr:hypothetical protein BgiMline_009470 [Biomphalaria glabrata]
MFTENNRNCDSGVYRQQQACIETGLHMMRIHVDGPTRQTKTETIHKVSQNGQVILSQNVQVILSQNGQVI